MDGFTQTTEPHPGVHVRALRKRLAISQEALADRSSLPRLEIVAIETGRHKVALRGTLRALARGFAVPLATMDDLLDGRITVDDALASMAQAATPAAA